MSDRQNPSLKPWGSLNSFTGWHFSLEVCYLCAVPDDQLLQNLPRAEMQQGYVVVAVCSALFNMGE